VLDKNVITTPLNPSRLSLRFGWVQSDQINAVVIKPVQDPIQLALVDDLDLQDR